MKKSVTVQMGASADLALPIIFVILFSGAASRDMEVFVNDTVSIRCSPNETVDIQWHHNSDLNYVFAGGRFFSPYKGRFRLEKDVTTGEYDLIIPNVILEDAGWYICEEELSGRRISTTQLTVLYVNPSCSSNMPSDGFVGPNTCDIQKENMTFSCDVEFNGRPPYVIWRSANDSQTFCSSSCEDVSSSRRICNLTLRADPLYDGSVFICDAITSSDRRFGCNLEMIKVWYLLADFENSEKKIQDSANCTVRSNANVQYNWTMKENNERTFLSANPSISFQKSGIYQCEVDYRISDVACSALVLNVNVDVIQKDQSTTTELAIAITLSIALVFVVAIGLFIYILYILALCDALDALALPALSIACIFVIALICVLGYVLSLRSTTTLLALAITFSIVFVVVLPVIVWIIYQLKQNQELRKTKKRNIQNVSRVVDEPLAEEIKSKIGENRETLLELIDTSQLIDRLKENRVFDEAQLNFISSKSTSKEQNEELLEILVNGNFLAFCLTIGCLHRSNQSHAENILLKCAI